MRSVRCEACGTRALMAASKCPKCGHEIEVRNGFGELLPLARCSTCDSYYPERLGACRWCGTPPQRAPIGPFVWKGVGIATFVAMAWGAWLVHDDPPAEVSEARLAAMLKPDSAAGALDSSMVASAPVDSVVVDSSADFDSTAVVASDSTIQSVATVVAAISDSMAQQSTTSIAAADSTPVVDSVPPAVPQIVPQQTVRVAQSETASATAPEPVAPRDAERPRVALSTRASTPAPAPPKARAAATKSSQRVVARAPERTTSSSPARASTTKPAARATTASKKPAPSVKAPPKLPARTVAKAPAKSRTTRVVWVNTVARKWVVVRGGPDRSSRVVASIGPNTRVQLGEARGGWRRIRAKGLAGWVEHRSFFAGGGGSRKTGSLAAR